MWLMEGSLHLLRKKKPLVVSFVEHSFTNVFLTVHKISQIYSFAICKVF